MAVSRAWFSTRVPALAGDSAPELVLLHGWGSSSAVWRSWLPLLRRRCNVTLLDLPGSGQSPAQPDLDIDALLDQLARYVPPGAALLGWSLGGMLALAFCARRPRHCSALLTLACNPAFVARPDWPHAMPAATLRAFQEGLNGDSETALRRFQVLQARGADDERALLQWLRRLDQPAPPPAVLAWGLGLLAQLDLRAALRDCALPGVHLFGSADALVPAAVAEAVAALAPEHVVSILDGASHLPFVSLGELCWQHLDRLLGEAGLLAPAAPPARDKRAVARAFSRAAASYDGAADLQRTVAAQLLAHAAPLPAGSPLLDLGCGTGAVSAQLAATHTVVAVDLAEGMVAQGRRRHAGAAVHWLCGDAENLPLADAAVDGVFSSLALQWCERPAAVFAELRRVLRPGASAWLATLGPDTLRELRAAWGEVDGYVHVNRFADRAQLDRALLHTGLRCVQWREQALTLEYGALRQLTGELKALGVRNVNSGRPGGLSGRRRLQRFSVAYEQHRNARGKLPASYQVWYLQVKKDNA
jgi:malonyl-CoA O-methyltransferase